MPELYNPFVSLLVSYQTAFQESGHHHVVANHATCTGLLGALPALPGVYLIRDTTSDRLLYIGCTGKISRNRNNIAARNKGTLRGRMGRWTPYSFKFNPNHFSYCVNYAPGTTARGPNQVISYNHKIAVANISIEAFAFDAAMPLSPSVLEHLLLQGFLNQFGSLPVCNNEL
jgi:hypothetical protein